MSVITRENAPMWTSLLGRVAEARPEVGMVAVPLKGKYRGRAGVITRHIVDRFYDPFRYGSSAQHMMTEARGRRGYVVKIAPLDGSPAYWTKAEYLCVAKAEGAH